MAEIIKFVSKAQREEAAKRQKSLKRLLRAAEKLNWRNENDSKESS